MNKQKFINELSEYCEYEGGPFTPETEFNSIDDYDSLSILSIIAFLDEKYSIRITGEEALKMNTFNSVIELIGVDKFDD